jgi:hypothetical protein
LVHISCCFDEYIVAGMSVPFWSKNTLHPTPSKVPKHKHSTTKHKILLPTLNLQKTMNAHTRISFLLITRQQNVQLNLFGGRKPAKSQEEDLELARTAIMTHEWVLTESFQTKSNEKIVVNDGAFHTKPNEKSVANDDDIVVGNLISDSADGGEDAIDKIKSFGRKIKGKFKNKKKKD